MNDRESDYPSKGAVPLKLTDIFDEMHVIMYQMEEEVDMTRIVMEEQRLARETGAINKITDANGALNNVQLAGERLEHDGKVVGRYGAITLASTETKDSMDLSGEPSAISDSNPFVY